jgi:hypothetical protein
LTLSVKRPIAASESRGTLRAWASFSRNPTCSARMNTTVIRIMKPLVVTPPSDASVLPASCMTAPGLTLSRQSPISTTIPCPASHCCKPAVISRSRVS